jgi:hypothetical protein
VDTVGTVGTDMKTAYRMCDVLYERIGDGMITNMSNSMRMRAVKKTNTRNIWVDYTWVRNNALCQSPENPK